MVDLGISRIQDLLSSLPGLEKVRSIPERNPGAQDQKSGAAQNPTEAASRGENAADDSPTLSSPLYREELEREVSQLNDFLRNKTSIRFVINQETEDIYIEIVDEETKQVLKTIPPSDIRLVRSRLTKGSFLVDNKG